MTYQMVQCFGWVQQRTFGLEAAFSNGELLGGLRVTHLPSGMRYEDLTTEQREQLLNQLTAYARHAGVAR